MLCRANFLLLAVSLGAVFAQQPAQGRSGGFRGPPGLVQPNTVSLLAEPDVRKELNVDDEQARKIDAILDDLQRPRTQAEFQETQKLSPEERQKSFTENENRLKSILGDIQRRRLDQLLIQVQGAIAVLRPDIAKSLQLTDAQRKRIIAIAKSAPPQPRLRALPSEQQQKALDDWWAVRKELEAQILNVLTDEQRSKFANIRGEEFVFPRPNVSNAREGQGDARRSNNR